MLAYCCKDAGDRRYAVLIWIKSNRQLMKISKRSSGIPAR
jgi:hypothetical protein